MTCMWCRTYIFKRSSKRKNTETAFVTLATQQLFNSLKQCCVMGRLGDTLSWFPVSSYGCNCGRWWKKSASVYNKSGKVVFLGFLKCRKARRQRASQAERMDGHEGRQAPCRRWDALYLLGTSYGSRRLLLWSLTWKTWHRGVILPFTVGFEEELAGSVCCACLSTLRCWRSLQAGLLGLGLAACLGRIRASRGNGAAGSTEETTAMQRCGNVGRVRDAKKLL